MSEPNQTVPELEPIQFQFEFHFILPDDDAAISSSTYPFTVPDYGNEEWFLQLSFNRHDNYGLHLMHRGEPKKFSIDLMFTIRNYLFSDYSFSKKYSGTLSKENGFDPFISDHDARLIANLSDGQLHIVCEAKLTPLPPAIIEPSFEIPGCGLAHHFGLLYNDETTADVTLIANEKKFHVHRVILTARSSYFATMFKGDWKETVTKKIDATDMDANTLEQVLRFIYTDQIPDLQVSNVIYLLDAADRYDLQKLKIMCEKTLYQNINVENVAEIVVMADRYRASQLKTQAFRFIGSNMKEVIETGGYRNLKEHHPGLIVELFEEFATI